MMVLVFRTLKYGILQSALQKFFWVVHLEDDILHPRIPVGRRVVIVEQHKVSLKGQVLETLCYFIDVLVIERIKNVLTGTPGIYNVCIPQKFELLRGK